MILRADGTPFKKSLSTEAMGYLSLEKFSRIKEAFVNSWKIAFLRKSCGVEPVESKTIKFRRYEPPRRGEEK